MGKKEFANQQPTQNLVEEGRGEFTTRPELGETKSEVGFQPAWSLRGNATEVQFGI